MRRTLTILTLLASALLLPAAHAQSLYSDFYVIPAASHTAGVNGTLWMSDVAIQNFSPSPMTVQLVVVSSGEGNADNIAAVATSSVHGSATVPANGSVMLKDVLNGQSGAAANVSGALLVGADRPFALTSRSYSRTPDGNTIGQTVPPARDFLDNSFGTTNNATAVAYVPGLISNAQFRTNLGFVAANGSSSGAPMTLTVTLHDANGGNVGSRTFRIAGGAIEHVQFSSRSVGSGNASFDVGSAEFRITQGSGAVVPYASVIDNGSADAVFILGQFPANTPAAGKMGSPSPFRDLFDRYKQ